MNCDFSNERRKTPITHESVDKYKIIKETIKLIILKFL